jgi:hypothetical protein
LAVGEDTKAALKEVVSWIWEIEKWEVGQKIGISPQAKIRALRTQ